MVDGIGLALTSIKSAADIAKTLFELRDISKVSGITTELQGQIAAAQALALAAQREQAALVGKVHDLEKQIVRFETWESEKQRYELHDLGDGRFTYRLKEGAEPSEPPHQICAHCYQGRVKSILQTEMWMPGRCEVLVCQECSSCVYVYGAASQEHAALRRRT